MTSDESFTSTDIFNLKPDDEMPRNMQDAALHITKISVILRNVGGCQYKYVLRNLL